jgi:high-affinity iron transporter
VIPTFIIGLREGLEAALIVGIIAAFLIQRGRRSELRWMWVGVAAASALCIGVASITRIVGRELPERQREGMTAAISLIAVVAITYMIMWMRRHSRFLKRSLERSAEGALAGGTVLAIVGMAFFAVLREGLETAVFLLAAFQASSNPTATAVGAVLGIGVAIGLGYAIYMGGVRINLARFFRFTGFVLVLVAAGLLATAVEAGTEAGLISFLERPALDLHWFVAEGTLLGALMTGMFGVRPEPSWGQVLAWICYAVPMAAFVLWPHRPAGPERAAAVSNDLSEPARSV